MRNNHQHRELQQLLVAAAAGEADAADWQQLSSILQQSESARDYAVTLLDQLSSLEWNAQESLASISADVACARSIEVLTQSSPQRTRVVGLIVGGTLAVALLLGCVALWKHTFDHPLADATDVETHDAGAAKAAADRAPDSTGGTVAWLLEMTPDAAWAAGSGPDEFLLRLLPGKRLELLSGFARIEFASGAIVILEGPCVFIPTGGDSAALVRGRVTGRADNGNFHLTTPAARVVDLGTEFGVAVDNALSTDVIVFKGSVSVSPSDWKGQRDDTVLLDAGGTARVDANGDLATGIAVKSKSFHRDLPRSADEQLPAQATELSLVDVVCGGGLAGSIDPLTGGRDARPWQLLIGPGITKSDGQYHRVSSHPMIDGVFIPSSQGGDTTVCSDDQQFDLPKNDGVSWGPIWARKRVIGNLPDSTNDYWGTNTLPHLMKRLETSRSGLLGIHANVGITFDLQGCEKEHLGRFRSLQSTLVKLDLAAERGPENLKLRPHRTIDFWVVVDGELRFNKRNIGPSVDGLPFEVPLRSDDRFLTLITTDGGDSVSFDNAFLVDPVLTISDGTP